MTPMATTELVHVIELVTAFVVACGISVEVPTVTIAVFVQPVMVLVAVAM